jgi:hypothetical protein
MTVLTICLVQSASAKRRPPGRKSRALLELLSILWEIASGRQDFEWDRAIRTVRSTTNPETVPAYVSASREAADLVEDTIRRVKETPWDEVELLAEIKENWKGPVKEPLGAKVYDTPEEYFRFMRENGLTFAPEYKFAEGEGD